MNQPYPPQPLTQKCTTHTQGNHGIKQIAGHIEPGKWPIAEIKGKLEFVSKA